MSLLKRSQIAGMNQHYRKYSLDYFLDSQEKAGIEGIEFWCGAPHFWIDSDHFDHCRPVRTKAADRGIRIVSVTIPSFACQYQYASPDRYGWERSYGYFANGVRVASELGCTLMTVNSGYELFSENRMDAWNRSREMLARLGELAGQEGITLALESLRDDESGLVNDLESAKRMYLEVGHPSLKLMVDTIASGAAGESLDDWFNAFGRDLVHLHFLDGDPYVHNIWGDGNYPLEEMLKTLQARGYDGYLVQEVADEKYFDDPAAADLANMQVLERFLSD